MTTTVLEKHEHVFELENAMPVYPRKAPKSIYKDTLIVRGGFLTAGIILAVIFSFFPEVGEPLTFLPIILIIVAIIGIWDALFKVNQKWHKDNMDKVRYGLANLELLEKLTELNPLYKGRRDDSVMFYSGGSAMNDFFVYHVWSRYIQKQNPTKRELVKGFGDAHTGGCLYITDDEGWSFDPEFLSPNRYKVTVKRVQWDNAK